MIKQVLLPIKVKNDGYLSGMTSLAGMLPYLELMWASKLGNSIKRHVKARPGDQGWTEVEVCMAIILLNLAGGNCVNDLRTLEGDEGFCRLFKLSQQSDLRGRSVSQIKKRWRSTTKGDVPSNSSAFRVLTHFHNEEQESIRHLPTTRKAFIPEPNAALRGLSFVNRDLVAFAQLQRPLSEVTVDVDATLIPTHIKTAQYCYKKISGVSTRAFQPVNVWLAEHELMLYTEFRDGNVNAGYDIARVFREALEYVPPGVRTVRLRSDAAAYQFELMDFCEKGLSPRFGRIEFAISCSRSESFRKAVAEVPDDEWQPLYRTEGGRKVRTSMEWAEVCFVPKNSCRNKNSPLYRYLATREPLRNRQTGEQLELELKANTDGYAPPSKPVKTKAPKKGTQLELALDDESDYWNSGQYKLFGIVTNISDWSGEDVINWLRERCGDSEQAHSVLKSDLAGGQMPSQLFGANAAWWWLSVIAHNEHSIMKQHVLPKEWRSKRLKAIRFSLINIAGRIVSHARYLIMQLSAKQHMADFILEMRRRIASLVPCPSG